MYYLSPNKKFEANLTLPIRADVTYKLKEKFWMGFRFDGIGTSYNLNDQNYSNNGAYVSKVSIEMTPYFRFKVSISKNVESLNISNTVAIVCHHINHVLKKKN